jgi:lipopolysaccharide biosynthesis regulator YciM
MNEALVKLDVVSKKESMEKCMEEWINSDPQRKEKYGDVLTTLQEAYISTNELAKYTTYFLETFQNGIEIIRFANTLLQFDANGTQQEKEEFINDRIIND